MGVLELHSTHQARNFVEGTEGCGPVGDGQAGIVAGHQGAGNDEKKGRARGEDGKAVERGVVWCRSGLQKWTP